MYSLLANLGYTVYIYMYIYIYTNQYIHTYKHVHQSEHTVAAVTFEFYLGVLKPSHLSCLVCIIAPWNLFPDSTVRKGVGTII